MGEVSPLNKLNNLTAQQWLPFTKTWFVHNPPKRKKNELLHPAKYPENLIAEFIAFFSKPGQTVFDPFLGTGSTLVACQQTGRNGIGIELQQKYADIAQRRVDDTQQVICGNSVNIATFDLPQVDFVITSPPYGFMLQKKALAAQKRKDAGVDTHYSNDKEDLGNALTYTDFLEKLTDVFTQIKPKLRENGYLVVILQNYMHKGTYTTLAWDVAKELGKHFQFKGEKIWCQDNKTLYPYGYRYSFVPNVHHHYCLIFKNVPSGDEEKVKSPAKPVQDLKKLKLGKEKEEKEEVAREVETKEVDSQRKFLQHTISQDVIALYRQQAEQKITAEGWGKQGRNVTVKRDNFVHCWITEEAFKQILMQGNIWFRNRGLYFGDSRGAGADFTVKVNGKEVTLGLRSIAPDSLYKWKVVSYPDDRIKLEPEKIADYIVVCNHESGVTKFFGALAKEKMLAELATAKRMYSKKNQEYFRTVPLEMFAFSTLQELVGKMDKV